MAEQIRHENRRTVTKQEAEQLTDEEITRQVGQTALKKDELTKDIEDILDEIDGVLEQNAEQFVNSYIQAGGQ